MTTRLSITAAVLALMATAAFADHQYLTLDIDGSLLVTGPFNLVIPMPPPATPAKTEHTHDTFGMENLKTSRGGYYDEDRILIIEVETTDAAPGTINYEGMAMVEMAGLELPSRSGCVEISQEQIDAGDEPLLVFAQKNGWDPTPAVYARQIFLVNDDGTGEGVTLFAKRVNGCAEADEAFIVEFDSQFERFVKSVRAANRPEE
ncbi:MAG: hypothetical protein JSV45_10950 [Chromatiales bacterium]|nr:MAG: hypothetical protein JSV45_10950 [Chromatiales bacterium]